jgi:hypothetical protein
MGIPLAHYKSESYQGVNVAKTKIIIGNARTTFGNPRVIARGRCIRPVGIKCICNLSLTNPAECAGFILFDYEFVL